MPKLSPIRSRELLAILKQLGFMINHQKGSHARLIHPDGRKTTVPLHAGEKIGIGLLGKIIRDIHISREEFQKLK